MKSLQQTVLLVEDEVLIRWAMADALEEAGYVVLEASNVLEAIAHLGRTEAIDVVVTDVDMPGALDGLDLARMVAECAPRIDIIISSGRCHPARDTVPVKAQIMPKPCLPDRLVAAVAELMAVRQQPSGPKAEEGKHRRSGSRSVARSA